MAKPNYQYEKRQRDLAKKLKKEEKARQKLANKAASGSTEDPAGTPASEDNTTATPDGASTPEG